ncbi:hypothetical protein AVEN_164523-1 [Araneus ventricosus]|uniref:Uncharacterized protein n=1 Tax=Araneus ventricosus TaxID=182803 RepID=A0A4Y2B4W6_ARAVE|nr:hypothetical protein AVEN_164523-1 [Araneus ventricosus]
MECFRCESQFLRRFALHVCFLNMEFKVDIQSICSWIGMDLERGLPAHVKVGIRLFFEHAARARNSITDLGKFSFMKKFQLQIEVKKTIEGRIKIYPTRFGKILIDPDAEEEAFW